MTPIGKLLPVILAALVCGAGLASPREQRVEPYGVWLSPLGDLIIIRRDGAYDFCNQGGCETGRYRLRGNTEAVALGLEKMKNADRLIQAAHLRPASHQGDLTEDFVVGDQINSASERREHCAGDPCFLLGAADQGEPVYIRKIINY